VSETLRLMAVHAHPDDESSKGAATMARYVAQGVDVLVVTCTGGERGSVLNPKLDTPEVLANITEIRRAEMDRARDILGVRQTWLGFVDSGLPEGDPLPPLPEGCFALVDVDTAAAELVKVVRDFRPHVMITYDEKGGYPHPDHIQCHNVSVAAFAAAADPQRYPEVGEAWQTQKLYYHMGFSKRKIVALHEAILATGADSPYAEWLESWDDSDDERDGTSRITTRVHCVDYFDVRDDALRAHATQVDPDGFWFRVPREIQRGIWPTEDFELARSHVGTAADLAGPAGYEEDLFTGVVTEVGAAGRTVGAMSEGGAP
jgi:mycothiol S-conjugate amidase